MHPDLFPPRVPAKKFEDKVFIPQDDHPETNFVGLLIGPRGHTLKQLERDVSPCSITYVSYMSRQS